MIRLLFDAKRDRAGIDNKMPVQRGQIEAKFGGQPVLPRKTFEFSDLLQVVARPGVGWAK